MGKKRKRPAEDMTPEEATEEYEAARVGYGAAAQRATDFPTPANLGLMTKADHRLQRAFAIMQRSRGITTEPERTT